MKKLINFLKLARDRQLVGLALSRGAVAAQLRNVDLTDPTSWEMSVFSQNGEDGVIDVLLKQLTDRNKYFLEIGASTGVENNSSFLAVVHRFKGVMVEGSALNSGISSRLIGGLCITDVVKFLPMFVTRDTVPHLFHSLLFRNPDFFSLDIDGNDYYVAEQLLSLGFRPKVVCVEYNASFGPEEWRTIPYQADFVAAAAHPTGLYQGCSIALWRNLWAAHGYAFVCVESNGVNAFFVDRSCVDPDFLAAVRGACFAENILAQQRYGPTWSAHFELIRDLPLVNPRDHTGSTLAR